MEDQQVHWQESHWCKAASGWLHSWDWNPCQSTSEVRASVGQIGQSWMHQLQEWHQLSGQAWCCQRTALLSWCRWVRQDCIQGWDKSQPAWYSAERLDSYEYIVYSVTLCGSPFFTLNSQAPPDCNASLSQSQLGEENMFPRCFFCSGWLNDPLDVLLVWRWWRLTAVALVVSYVNFMSVNEWEIESWYTTLLPITSSEIGLSNTLLDAVEVAHLLERKRGIGGSELDVDCDTTLGVTIVGTVSGWENDCTRDRGAVVGCNGCRDTLREWVGGGEEGSSLSRNTSNPSHWASGTMTNKLNCLVLNTIAFEFFRLLALRQSP